LSTKLLINNQLKFKIMKTTLKFLTITCLFFIVFNTVSYCQDEERFDKRWSFTLSGGSMLFYGDLRQNDFYPNTKKNSIDNHNFPGDGVSERKWGYGLSLNKQFSPVFEMRLQLQSGKLAGYKKNAGVYFNTRFIDYGFNGVLYLGNYLIPELKKHNAYLYFIFGLSVVDFRSACYFAGIPSDTARGASYPPGSTHMHKVTDEVMNYYGYDTKSDTKKILMESDLKDDKATGEFAYSLGIGFKRKLSNKFEIGIETVLNFVNTDKLDAYVKKESGSSKDRYGYTAIHITYKISTTVMPFFTTAK